MNLQHLFKFSKSYAIVKKYTAFVHSWYYSNIIVINPENVPANEPIIFAPNHQNALMDALAIICTTDKQPLFMARADIFKKKLIIEILTFLKIIPVYRIRDGINSLSQNDESFNIALHALECGQAVGMMPEGNHGDKHRLRPLKKGISRLAFKAQEQLGSSMDVKIIPVGLEYSHYSNFRSKLLVIYGEPIEVNEYWNDYIDNPPKAFVTLQERLATEMKKLMLNIDSTEYYDLILALKDIYAHRLQNTFELKDDYYGLFLAEKIITDKLVKLPDVLESLQPFVTEYCNGLKRIELHDWLFDFKIPNTKTILFEALRRLIFLPFFLIATLVNFIPYYIPDYLSNRIQDTQFRSSYKFVLILTLFPIFYLLLLALPLPLITKLLIIFPMPLLGVLSYDYFISLKKLWSKIQYFKMMKENNYELTGLRQARDQIVRKLDDIFLS